MFNRLALRAAIKQALSNQRKEYDGKVAGAILRDDELRKAWLEKHTNTWIQACHDIVDKLARGHVIERDDVPSDGTFRGVLVYANRSSYDERGKRIVDGAQFEENVQMRALLVLLDATYDEEISTSALKNLGFNSFRSFMPYLATTANEENM